jgi:hypothetical protein
MVQRMQNQRMAKKFATATMEGTRKRGRPRKRWKDDVEEDVNIMGIKNRQGSGERPSVMEEDCIGS